MTAVRDALAAAFPDEGCDPSLRELTGVLADWKRTEVIENFLREIVSNEETLASVARQSYRHDNGFWKVVIGHRGPVKLRVHIWNNLSMGPSGDSNIHNHRWDFSSLLLCGGYRQQIFSINEFEAPGIRVSHFQYYPRVFERMDSGEDYLTFIDRTSLQLVENRMWNSPEILDVPSTTLHRVLIHEDTFVASLFLQGTDRCGFTNVYCEGEPARIRSDVNRAISATELSRTLSLLLGML
jgi:hypothetical protein